MHDTPWKKYLLALVIALGCVGLAIVGTPFALFGWLILWERPTTYADYDQVNACLERHQFEVLDGAQHQDLTLEDFSWKFRTADRNELAIEIYDGDWSRDCSHRAVGVQLLEDSRFWMSEPSLTSPVGSYLSFEHPDLVAALGGKQLRNMEDMLANLDELLAWVEQNPDYAVHSAEVEENSGRYLNLVVFQE